MKTLGVRELKEHISEILRMVQEEGEIIEVTNRGEVIAHVIPARKVVSEDEESNVWTDLDRLAGEISAYWPKGVNAIDALHDARGEL